MNAAKVEVSEGYLVLTHNGHVFQVTGSMGAAILDLAGMPPYEWPYPAATPPQQATPAQPTAEQLTEMAYLLGRVPRGEVVSIQWMECLKWPYLAAMEASAMQAASPIVAAQPSDTERMEFLEKRKYREDRDGGWSASYRLSLPALQMGPWAEDNGRAYDHKTLRDAIDAEMRGDKP